MGYYKDGKYVYDAAEQAATFCDENGNAAGKRLTEAEIRVDERNRCIHAINEVRNRKGLHGDQLATWRAACKECALAIREAQSNETRNT